MKNNSRSSFLPSVESEKKVKKRIFLNHATGGKNLRLALWPKIIKETFLILIDSKVEGWGLYYKTSRYRKLCL